MKKFDLNQFADFLEHASDEIKNEIAADVTEKTAIEGVKIVVQQIDKQQLVDTGNLRQSVSAEPGNANDAWIGVSAPYADVMNKGRAPGATMPPFEAIYTWAVYKGIITDDAEGEQIAYLIQRGIKNNGIKGRHFFDKSLLRIKSKFRKNIISELEKKLPKG